MTHYLGIGFVLGLSAGLAPGPLLMLVISDTLRHGTGAGVKVALAPVLTDLPIILLSLYILQKLAAFQSVLGVISLAGGLFILLTAIESIRCRPVELRLGEREAGSLLKGVLANVLNPHPYLFWMTVGAPAMTRALGLGIGPLAGFLFSFYAALVGSKIILALAVGRSRAILGGRVYLATMRLLGIALLVLAVVLFRDGVRMLGW